jgi:hypothetical protein
MSKAMGGSCPAGMATEIGFVPRIFSTPPQGGMWLPFATVMYIPTMSRATGIVE